MSTARALAEEIRGSPAAMADPNAMHELLTDLAGVPDALAGWLGRVADELDDTGVHPQVMDAIRDAASAIAAAADELDDVTGEGVTGRSGPQNVRQPTVSQPKPAARPKPEPRPEPRPETATRPRPPDPPRYGPPWMPKPATAHPWVPGPAPLPTVVEAAENPSGYPARGAPYAPVPRPVTRKRLRRARRAGRKARRARFWAYWTSEG